MDMLKLMTMGILSADEDLKGLRPKKGPRSKHVSPTQARRKRMKKKHRHSPLHRKYRGA